MKVTAALVFALISFAASYGSRLPAQALQLQVELQNLNPQPEYSLQDSIALDIQIVNAGSQPVGVFAKLGMGYQGGVILHILDSAGTEVQPPVLAHDFLDLDAIGD